MLYRRLRGVLKFLRSDGSTYGYMATGGYTANVNSADTFSYTIPSPATALVALNDVVSPSFVHLIMGCARVPLVLTTVVRAVTIDVPSRSVRLSRQTPRPWVSFDYQHD